MAKTEILDTRKKAIKKVINKLIDESKYDEALEKLKKLQQYEKYMSKK